MTGADIVALLIAIFLVPIGGLIACVDSALARVSRARVEEFVREERRGAKALGAIMADRPRYTNLLLLLRLTCELTATVLVTIVARNRFGPGWPVTLGTVVVMVVICYAVIGVGPRTLGRQHFNQVALAGAAGVAAHPAGQRDHARTRPARRPVRVRGGAARTGRHGRGARRRRAR
jgi:CBS domain containing-hemolysin-like protein